MNGFKQLSISDLILIRQRLMSNLPASQQDTLDQEYVPESVVDECAMAFSIIMVVSTSKQFVCTGDILASFLHEIKGNLSNGDLKQQAVQILDWLNVKGVTMNMRNFSLALLRRLRIKFLRNQNDVKKLHQKIKRLLLRQSYYEIELIEKWDSVLYSQNPFQIEAGIKEFIKTQFKSYLQLKDDKSLNWLNALNKALMLISFPGYENEKVILDLYSVIFGLNIDVKISQNLALMEQTLPDLIFETLKSLCYLLTSAKYSKFQVYIQSQTQFGNPQLWTILISLCNSQITYVRIQSVIALTILCRYHSTFESYLYFERFDLLVSLCGFFAGYSVGQGMFQSLQFLSTLIRKLRRKLGVQKIAENNKIIGNLISFSSKIVVEKEMRVFQRIQSLHLIKELILGAKSISNDDIVEICKIIPVFLSQNSNMICALFEFVCDIIRYQYSICSQIFLSSTEFKLRLISELESPDSEHHFICLTILLQLSKTKNKTYLFDQRYINALIKNATLCDISSAKIITKLLQRIIQISVKTESKYFMLLQTNILPTLFALLPHTLSLTPAVSEYLKNDTKRFQDMDIFINIFTSFYTLFSHSKEDSVKTNHRKSDKFIETFGAQQINILRNAGNSIFGESNPWLIQQTLRLDVKVFKSPQKDIKFLKLISLMFEQLLILFSQSHLKKSLLDVKSIYYNKIYRIATLGELEDLNIPIFLTIGIEHQGKLVNASRLPKTSFLYFKKFVIYRLENLLNLKVIKLTFKDSVTNFSIGDDIEYKRSVNDAITSFKKLDDDGVGIVLKVRIVDLELKKPSLQAYQLPLENYVKQNPSDSDSQYIPDLNISYNDPRRIANPRLVRIPDPTIAPVRIINRKQQIPKPYLRSYPSFAESQILHPFPQQGMGNTRFTNPFNKPIYYQNPPLITQSHFIDPKQDNHKQKIANSLYELRNNKKQMQSSGEMPTLFTPSPLRSKQDSLKQESRSLTPEARLGLKGEKPACFCSFCGRVLEKNGSCLPCKLFK